VVAWGERYGAAKIAPFAFAKEEWIHRYVAEHDVPVNPLLKRGYKSIGCEPQTRPVAPEEDVRAGRWSGLEKTECGLHWISGKARSARILKQIRISVSQSGQTRSATR
jgi:phosphoadenosine phosphosulfate reductase